MGHADSDNLRENVAKIILGNVTKDTLKIGKNKLKLSMVLILNIRDQIMQDK